MTVPAFVAAINESKAAVDNFIVANVTKEGD
jgi:hypothetical protein